MNKICENLWFLPSNLIFNMQQISHVKFTLSFYYSLPTARCPHSLRSMLCSHFNVIAVWALARHFVTCQKPRSLFMTKTLCWPWHSFSSLFGVTLVNLYIKTEKELGRHRWDNTFKLKLSRGLEIHLPTINIHKRLQL